MLRGYKTYIFAGLAVLTAAAQFAVGDATAFEAARLAFEGVLAATIRNAIG